MSVSGTSQALLLGKPDLDSAPAVTRARAWVCSWTVPSALMDTHAALMPT